LPLEILLIPLWCLQPNDNKYTSGAQRCNGTSDWLAKNSMVRRK